MYLWGASTGETVAYASNIPLQKELVIFPRGELNNTFWFGLVELRESSNLPQQEDFFTFSGHQYITHSRSN